MHDDGAIRMVRMAVCRWFVVLLFMTHSLFSETHQWESVPCNILLCSLVSYDRHQVSGIFPMEGSRTGSMEGLSDSFHGESPGWELPDSSQSEVLHASRVAQVFAVQGSTPSEDARAAQSPSLSKDTALLLLSACCSKLEVVRFSLSLRCSKLEAVRRCSIGISQVRRESLL